MLRGYKAVEAFPAEMLRREVEFSPIDATAAAVLKLAGTGRDFHMFHAVNNHRITMGDVIYAMRDYGYTIRIVSGKKFEDIVNAYLAKHEGTVLCTLFYILASKGICGLFSIRKGELLSVTTGAIRIYALAVPFTGLNTFIMYTFQSQEKTTIATVLSLISSCAMMLIALFTLTAVFGSAGIWYTWVVAQVLSLFVSFSFYHFYTENRLDGGNITT